MNQRWIQCAGSFGAVPERLQIVRLISSIYTLKREYITYSFGSQITASEIQQDNMFFNGSIFQISFGIQSNKFTSGSTDSCKLHI